jgi:hypothetical protein
MLHHALHYCAVTYASLRQTRTIRAAREYKGRSMPASGTHTHKLCFISKSYLPDPCRVATLAVALALVAQAQPRSARLLLEYGAVAT